MKNSLSGTVYLVGAGPGDPDLLTVKAQRLLRECDALVYDSLVPLEILELVKQSCESIFVGKRRGHHSVPQSETNSVLLEFAQRFSCVVRLKGGDPFVFGRGAEEALFLLRHNVQVEVVPGITSGIAAPAYLGIPVTSRLASSSVTFVTGHEDVSKKRPSVNWRAIAKASDSLVIYMGIHNLTYIIDELIAGGLDPETPAVIIQQATVSGQCFLKDSLKNIANEVHLRGFKSPSIVIIGSVINSQIEECAPKPADVRMPILF